MKRYFGAIFSSKSTYVYLGIFLINLLIRLGGILIFPGHSSGLFTTPNDLVQTLGESDAGSYLKLAIDLMDLKVEDQNRWILLLWPPGMASINVISILSPFGFLFSFSVISAAIWTLPSIALYQSTSDFQEKKARACLRIAAFSLVALPFTFNYSLTLGFHNSDMIGIALLATGFVFILRSYEVSATVTKHQFLLAGLLVGGSLYFRWANLPIVLALAGLTGLALLKLTKPNVTSGIARRALNLVLPKITRTDSLHVLLGIFLVTTPWTLVSIFVLHPTDHSPLWAVTDWIWGYRWLLDSDLEAAGGTWLLDSGTNWACNISPLEVCMKNRALAQSQDSQYFDVLRNSALSAAIQNPGEFLAERMRKLGLFWFNTLGSSATVFHNYALGFSAILAGVLSSLLALISPKEHFGRFSVSVLPAGLVFSSLLFLHYEGRYLFPIFVLLWLGALYSVLSIVNDRAKSIPTYFLKKRKK